MSLFSLKLGQLAASCILIFSMARAQDPSPSTPTQPVIVQDLSDNSEQVPQYAVKWREFVFTDMSAPREDYLGITDIDWALSGSQLYLAHDRTYAVTGWTESRAGFPTKAVLPQPLPPLPAGPYYTALKYRHGSFYMKRGGTIYRFEPRQKRWMVHFSGTRAFTQFEILGKDRVALICPMPLADQPREDLPLVTGIVNKDNEKVPLVEIYARSRADLPERVLPFPEPVASTLGRVNNYPLVDRSLQVNDTYLLINGQAGQLFSFDANTWTVHPVATPWPCLDSRFLAGIERLELRPSRREGMVKISQFAFPVKIHPYLQNANAILFAVILNPLCEPGYSRNRDLRESSVGNRFAPIPKEYTREENAQWAWMKYYLYDLRTRTFTELKQPKLAGLRLDFAEHWLTLAGEAVPLSSFSMESRENQQP